MGSFLRSLSLRKNDFGGGYGGVPEAWYVADVVRLRAAGHEDDEVVDILADGAHLIRRVVVPDRFEEQPFARYGGAFDFRAFEQLALHAR